MKSASDQVTALERIPLGSPWLAAHAAAAAAIHDQDTAAVEKLFEATIKPVSGDSLSAFVFHQQRQQPSGFVDGMASVHLRSLKTWPDLAGLFRSIDALDDVGAAATVHARPGDRESHAAAGARAAAAARATYARIIAQQLIDADHVLSPAARALLATDDLTVRIARVRAAQEAHAAGELARAEEARLAAAAATDRAELAAEITAELALYEHRNAGEDERVRVAAMVTLRRRLRTTKATRMRIGRSIFNPAQTASGIGSYSIELLEQYTEALDREEAVIP